MARNIAIAAAISGSGAAARWKRRRRDMRVLHDPDQSPLRDARGTGL